MPEHKNIHEAILAVYSKVGYVQKNGKNTAQNYRYAGEADFIAALRPEMIENGIVVYPSGVKDKSVIEIRKGEKVTINLTATYLYTFVHVPTQTSIITEVSGEGSDSLDKGSYKAMTGAYKYALRQTFMIETGNDPEHDQKQDNVEAPSEDKLAKANKYVADQLEGIKLLNDAKQLNDMKTAVITSTFYNALYKYPELKKKLDTAFLEQAKTITPLDF